MGKTRSRSSAARRDTTFRLPDATVLIGHSQARHFMTQADPQGLRGSLRGSYQGGMLITSVRRHVIQQPPTIFRFILWIGLIELLNRLSYEEIISSLVTVASFIGKRSKRARAVFLTIPFTPQLVDRGQDAKRILVNQYISGNFSHYTFPDTTSGDYDEQGIHFSPLANSRLLTTLLDTIGRAPTPPSRPTTSTPPTFFFTGESFLSNFFLGTILYNNQLFSSGEQLYQYFKSIFANRPSSLSFQIRQEHTPHYVKKLGRTVSFSSINLAAWEEWGKIDAMRIVLLHKFISGSDMAWQLVNTKDSYLAEMSPFDHFWGTGFREDNFERHHHYSTHNHNNNHLGQLLMQHRDCIAGTSYYKVHY